MVKKIKIRKPRSSKPQSSIIRADQFSIVKEIEYIIGRAMEREACVVSLAELILFSSHVGDAWILDAKDKTALCLARAGERQDFDVTETPLNFKIEWTSEYRIEGDNFIVTDPSERVWMITGYPVREIAKAERRTA